MVLAQEFAARRGLPFLKVAQNTFIGRRKKLHFSSSPSAASINVRKPFTRSSSLKEVVEEQSLPKFSILKKKKDKGQGIRKLVSLFAKINN